MISERDRILDELNAAKERVKALSDALTRIDNPWYGLKPGECRVTGTTVYAMSLPSIDGLFAFKMVK